jgi:hypothetical protein
MQNTAMSYVIDSSARALKVTIECQFRLDVPTRTPSQFARHDNLLDLAFQILGHCTTVAGPVDFFFRFGGLWVPIIVLSLVRLQVPSGLGLFGLGDRYEVHFAAIRSRCADDY